MARTLLAALLILLATRPGAHAADDKPYVMKIALATLNDALHQFAKDYASVVEKDSGGRIKVEIYPGSQLGSTQRQAEGVQFGAIQCIVVPPEFLVGIDERYELLAAPGLVDSMAKGQRIAADPAVRQLMLGLGADKGLHGAGLFMLTPSAVIAIKPIRHLEDFKGKKIRIFASQIQSEALRRLGAIAKPMTLGEVLPALHDNILDGAIAATSVFVTMHYQEAAKYVTEIGQPAIFGVAALSKKWYDGLPADLQRIVDQGAALVSVKINPWIVEFNAEARQHWISAGGELISLPAEEQSTMVSALASVGKDISAAKPELYAAYHVIIDAAQRNQ
ncbi:MAG TPA: TRAP transporter substrate-binding protein [Xanthobacteraceae bacterium]|nr:TRAP transporter substrate-binding protein [Xanthobacteraceae bacterium]